MSFMNELIYLMTCALNVAAKDMNGQTIFDLTISCYAWITCLTPGCEYNITTPSTSVKAKKCGVIC